MTATITKWNPFKLRNLVGVALVLGIAAGVWLGDFFKGLGFGLGPGYGGGSASSGSGKTGGGSDSSSGTADLVGHHAEPSDADDAVPAVPSKDLVRILIDDRSYFLRQGKKKQPISLEALVRLIELTDPNEDGLRAMVDRTPSSRASAEIKLYDALKDAGIPANSVYLAPTAVE
jgi:hypothetical protein